jgi:hypothetical protein
MPNLITTKQRALALTAWLNREAGNPSDFCFNMYASGLPEVYFTVDLNGTGQCVEDFLVITLEESGTVKHTFDRDLTEGDVFVFRGVKFIILPTQKPKTKTLLKFSPRSNSYGLYYFPGSPEAAELLKKGRKTFRGDELVELLKDGYRVALDISQTLGGDRALVELSLIQN